MEGTFVFGLESSDELEFIVGWLLCTKKVMWTSN